MARPKRPGVYERLNLEMPAEVKRRIEHLRDDTRASSLAQVLERALAVYEHVINVEKDGGEIVVTKPGEQDVPLALLRRNTF